MYNLYVHVADGDGNIGQAKLMSVPMKWRLMSQGHRASGRLWQVNP